MKWLALDTSSRHCSVALTAGAEPVAELTFSGGRTHATHLLEMVRMALALADWPLERIEAFGVCVGPGTFTGLRIGISTVQGLAAAVDAPVVGIGSLRTLAAQAGDGEGVVHALIDARRRELYHAAFEVRDGRITRLSEDRVGPLERILDPIDGDAPARFVGGGALLCREAIIRRLGHRARFAPDGVHTLRASTLAALAEARRPGDVPVPVMPRYVRAPDAERNLGAKTIARDTSSEGAKD